LPANGTGTLRRLNTGFPGEGVVRAKTGTLGQVSTVVGYLGTQNGVLLVSLMYNGPHPWAARQAPWKLFRELGADGVVIPTDSIPAPPVQLGGDGDGPPAWLGDSLSIADSVGTHKRRRGRQSKGRGWTPAAFSLTIAAKIAPAVLLRRLCYVLRALTATSTTPLTSAMPASSGGIGTDSLFSAVASIGPTSSTFSFRVKEKPPRANPTTPTTIRMIPMIVPGFISGADPGSRE
jgi:hypothetical protein